MIEFALTFMVIIFVLFLLFEFSMWIYCYNVMADAAKAGVRYAIVHGVNNTSPSGPNSCTSPCSSVCYTSTPGSPNATVAGIANEVTKWASFSTYSTANLSTQVCYLDGSNKPPNRVQVKLSNPVTPFFGNLWSTSPITATAQGRIVN